MVTALKMFIIMTFIGALGSGIGGFLGGIVKVSKKGYIASLIEITAGIMTGIVCFDMIPESIVYSDVPYTAFGLIIGVVFILLLDLLSQKINVSKKYKTTSLIIMLSMAVHNIIEGIATGCSFSYSFSMGVSVLISIVLHDIPEGMVVGLVNKIDEVKIKDIIFNSSVVGAFFGLGAGIGNLLGNISNTYIAFCLSLAAGAMLYVVSCDLIPNSKETSKNRFISIFYIVGILIGLLIIKM